MELFLHYLSMPYMIQGIIVTLQATALGLGGGLILGLILAGMQLGRFRLLPSVARICDVSDLISGIYFSASAQRLRRPSAPNCACCEHLVDITIGMSLCCRREQQEILSCRKDELRLCDIVDHVWRIHN